MGWGCREGGADDDDHRPSDHCAVSVGAGSTSALRGCPLLMTKSGACPGGRVAGEEQSPVLRELGAAHHAPLSGMRAEEGRVHRALKSSPGLVSSLKLKAR